MCKKDFPKGLVQPNKGHKFSIDSVFLSCFVFPQKGQKIIDLGCGCGVISIGILLKNHDTDLKVVGIDIDPYMIECAKENAKKFGVEKSFTLILGDVKKIKEIKEIKSGEFDIGVINPPYRDRQMGRLSFYRGKNRARFEEQATLDDFICAAHLLIKNRGRVFIVYLTERIVYLFSVLKKYNFEPKRIRFIHGHIHKPSKIFLLEAIKNGNPSLTVEPPIIQYKDSSGENQYTDDTLKFCPFLIP